jgi:hypothetical protein
MIIEDLPTGTTDEMIEDIISDYLSESCGFCVFGFHYEAV